MARAAKPWEGAPSAPLGTHVYGGAVVEDDPFPPRRPFQPGQLPGDTETEAELVTPAEQAAPEPADEA